VSWSVIEVACVYSERDFDPWIKDEGSNIEELKSRGKTQHIPDDVQKDGTRGHHHDC